MTMWKRALVQGAGFGAALGLMFAVLAGGWFWYSGRPKPPKPWDSSALTASFSDVTTEGPDNRLAIYYDVQNNTDFDYQLVGKGKLTAALRRSGGLSNFENDGTLALDPSLFIPARHKTRVGIHLSYPYSQTLADAKTREAYRQQQQTLKKYIEDELPNIDGFVLFDEATRYELRFPNVWGESAKP